MLPVAAGQFAIDAGCGSGVIADYLASSGAEVMGVDANAEAIEFASGEFVRPNLRFIRGLVDDEMQLERAVDKFYSLEVIEHIYRPQGLAMLRSFHRLLRRGEQALAATVREVQHQLPAEHEIIIVDDGSGDGTWETIGTLAKVDPRIRGARLSRNFGKEAAIAAGLELARGDAAIVMDCDLQHPPQLLGEMIALWQRGDAEVVEAFKRTRGRLTSRAFYALFERLSGIDLVGASDFKLLDRRVLDSYNRLRERNVFFRGLTAWLGFRRVAV